MDLVDLKDLGLGLVLSFLLSIAVKTSHSSDFAGKGERNDSW